MVETHTYGQYSQREPDQPRLLHVDDAGVVIEAPAQFVETIAPFEIVDVVQIPKSERKPETGQ